jgi:hypothetical protein
MNPTSSAPPGGTRTGTAPAVIRFYQAISKDERRNARTGAAAGIIPTRACRYCEAMTSASAFGWHWPSVSRECGTGAKLQHTDASLCICWRP